MCEQIDIPFTKKDLEILLFIIGFCIIGGLFLVWMFDWLGLVK